MTTTELDHIAERVSRGYDYLSAQEYEGPEFNRVFPVYADLCEQLRAGLGLPEWR